jgi:SAM-dependent methyltransferase
VRTWELSPEEWQRVRAARRGTVSALAAARLLLRAPRLIPEVLVDLLAHARQGLWQSSALVWALDGERVRAVVPDASRGIGFTDPEPFLGFVRPRLDASMRVLDCGGGDGRIARLVAPFVRELVCSDVSPVMVREAAENLAEFPHASTFLARGFTLRPLVDGSFDLAYAQGVLSYLEPNQGLALLDELHRVVRPGGTLVVNAFTMERPEWAREQLEAVRHSARRGRFTAGLFRPYCEAQVRAMVAASGFDVVDAGYGAQLAARRWPYVVVGIRQEVVGDVGADRPPVPDRPQ